MDAKGFELLMSAKILGSGGVGAAMDAKGFERLMAAKILGKSDGGKIEELEGVPPLTFTANGQPLLDYRIYGNTEQTGTPTPESPIMPNGCGERTENVFDKNNYNIIRANAGTGQGVLYGVPETASYAVCIPVTGGETYSFYSQATLRSSCFTVQTPAVGVSIVVNGVNTFAATNVRIAPADAKYLVIFLETSSATQDVIDFDLATLTVVKSSAAPTSYTPYGYKLPIALGSTTTNIYLGEVQSMRMIKKLVLTGKEKFDKNTTSSSNYLYYRPRNALLPNSIEKTPLICNELPVTNEAPVSQIGISSNNNFNVIYINFGADVMNAQPSGNTVAGLKEYLAAQYAAGTPVTIWYVLAEPETAVVNEPLMKISNYADTVSMEQAGVSIPTNKGSTTLDVDTTIKPSNVYIKYKS